jgi:N-acyl-D-amino-acid deacylase
MRLALLTVLTLACHPDAAPPKAPAKPASYDVRIINGELIDGSGKPRFRADVGIRGDTIVKIGELSGDAKITIDAKGRTVAPGFIDLHSHSDMPLLTDGNGRARSARA